METVMSRIGRLLGMRMHSPKRLVPEVQQDKQAVQSSANTFKVEATSSKRHVLLKPKHMKLHDSIDKVMQLRAQGLTYKDIGQSLKMSKQRVYQIILAGKQRDIDKEKWTYGLSVRNAKLMEKLGIESHLDLSRAIVSGDIMPYRWPNFGRKSYVDLCQWLGVEPKEDKPKRCSHCGK